MAELLRPPGLPAALEGVLNLAGTPIPVVSLGHLFRLSTQLPGLYSMTIVLRLPSGVRIGMVVERVTEILDVAESSLRLLDRDDSFNGCGEAVVDDGDRKIHVLSPARIVLAKERDALSEFHQMAEHRLQEWQALRA